MCGQSLGDVTSFADVEGTVGTTEYVNERHSDDDAIVAKRLEVLSKGPSTLLGMTLSLSKGQGILPDDGLL